MATSPSATMARVCKAAVISQHSTKCNSARLVQSPLQLSFLQHQQQQQRPVRYYAFTMEQQRQQHRYLSVASKSVSFSTKSFPSRSSTNADYYNHDELYNGSDNDDLTELEIEGEEYAPMTPPPSLLSSRTNHLLYHIPIGQMKRDDMAELQRIQIDLSHQKTEKGAEEAEKLLERLVLEREHSIMEHRENMIQNDSSNDGKSRNDKSNIVTVGTTPYNVALNAWAKSGATNAPERAESILSKMKERYEKEMALAGGNNDIITSTTSRADTITYNSLLLAWSRSLKDEATQKVEELLSEMESLAATNNDDVSFSAAIKPDRTTYNIVINAYANRVDEYGSAKKAEDVLFKMSELSREYGSDLHPDTSSFNTILKAWANSPAGAAESGSDEGAEGGLESVQRAEEFLDMMIRLQKDGNDTVQPNAVSFATVIGSYLKIDDGNEAVRRTENMLNLMEKTYLRDDTATTNASFGNALSCYNSALNVIAKSGLSGAGIKAESIFQRMMDFNSDEKAKIEPNVIAHTSVIEAWSKQGTIESAKKAELLLRQMMEPNSTIRPNTITFNVVMDAWMRSGAEDTIRRVENLFRAMNDYSRNNSNKHKYTHAGVGGDTRPNTATCAIVIQAYSQCENSALKAHDVLQRMERSYQHGYASAKPDGYAYNAVISMLSKSNHPKAGKLAYDTLVRLLENEKDTGFVDTITFNVAIAAQGKNGNASSAERAMKLFNLMEKTNRENDNNSVQPDTISFTSLINVLEKSNNPNSPNLIMKLLRQMDGLERGGSDVVRLDAIAFRVALRVLSRFGDAERAREVFSWMEELYENGREDLKPDEACYNSILWAYTREVSGSSSGGMGRKRQRNKGGDPPLSTSSSAAEKAQELLVHMIQRFRQGETDTLPGKGGFNAVVNAWANLGDRKGIRKAELLVKLMEELYQSGATNFDADSTTYSMIISALARSTNEDAAEKAQELLEQMESKDLLDTIAFNSTISAWAKSKNPNKAEKAQSLLQRMIDLHSAGDPLVKADIVSYNSVLNACAFTRGSADSRKKALMTAEDTFRQVQESDELIPQQLTFGTMIKAITNLTDKKSSKADRIRPIFAECAEKGLVGNMVLKEIQYSLSEAEQKSLLESFSEHDADINRIPHQWSRNVGKKH